jgi:hypothetical protein
MIYPIFFKVFQFFIGSGQEFERFVRWKEDLPGMGVESDHNRLSIVLCSHAYYTTQYALVSPVNTVKGSYCDDCIAKHGQCRKAPEYVHDKAKINYREF